MVVFLSSLFIKNKTRQPYWLVGLSSLSIWLSSLFIFRIGCLVSDLLSSVARLGVRVSAAPSQPRAKMKQVRGSRCATFPGRLGPGRQQHLVVVSFKE